MKESTPCQILFVFSVPEGLPAGVGGGLADYLVQPPTLQMWRLRPGAVKCLSQGRKASEWQTQVEKRSLPISCPVPLPLFSSAFQRIRSLPLSSFVFPNVFLSLYKQLDQTLDFNLQKTPWHWHGLLSIQHMQFKMLIWLLCVSPAHLLHLVYSAMIRDSHLQSHIWELFNKLLAVSFPELFK